jgi:hypothetical protein
MSSDGDDDETGNQSPSKDARQKHRKRDDRKLKTPKRAETTVELIDKLLLQVIEIAVIGKPRKVTTLEAILFRLWEKEVLGDTRALKIRLKYQEFARQQSRPRIETVFVDNEYTTAFAAVPLKKDEDDE